MKTLFTAIMEWDGKIVVRIHATDADQMRHYSLMHNYPAAYFKRIAMGTTRRPATAAKIKNDLRRRWGK